VKQDDASAVVVEFQGLQPAGSTAAEIANELNNLLAVIIGNAELLKEVPDSPKLTRHMSDYILKAAERGATLAQRLQALSRH
jgi:signal transduction histidine kinase